MLPKLMFLLAVVPLVGLCAGAGDAPLASPPVWAQKGVYIYRVSTPDDPTALTHLEQGIDLVSNLIDGSVPQVTIINGLIGDDHLGGWNWDGLWPYWGRVTFRAGSWDKLAGFMARIQKNANASASFHLNLTDVNIGLRDYPESREFFKELVDAKAIYRRDYDQAARQRTGTPYTPQEIDCYGSHDRTTDKLNPVEIFALVDYKKFWDSGLARKTIDEFYGRLPYAPPVLYLDVLNLSGGNFSTGYPDGPLGGSEESQAQGVAEIVDYLRSKGTDLGTEGNRKFLGNNAAGLPRAGYVWYHGDGFSKDDYSVISGGSQTSLAAHHVFGNPGAFNLSPVASTAGAVAAARDRYAALLAGKPDTKMLPNLDLWHISMRSSNAKDEFDIPGANGDVFRGDWSDLVNYFYMAVIQENYHMGNRAVRERFSSVGRIHLGSYTLSGPDGEIRVSVPDFVTVEWRRVNAQRGGSIMLEEPLITQVMVTKAGTYPMKLTYRAPGRGNVSQLNVYVNGKLYRAFDTITNPENSNDFALLDVGNVELNAGENAIAFDPGSLKATWTDGTIAEWTTPYLRTGFKAWKDDVVFAYDYDRMWPDTWSGQKKIYFFSWDGTARTWKLPADWADVKKATLYPLTPSGRGKGMTLPIQDRSLSPKLLRQVPYILIP